MLKTRVFTALIFTPVLLALVWQGGFALQLCCLILALLIAREFFQLSLDKEQRVLKIAGISLTFLFAVSAVGLLGAPTLSQLVVLACLGTWIFVLAQPDPIANSTQRVAITLLGALYSGILIAHLSALRALPQGRNLAIAALSCTWAADTSAYFAGRFFGRHKLYAKISPAKTVEGGIGGIVGSCAVALGLHYLLKAPWPAFHSLLLGALAALFGAIGDLCESLLKRSVGAKDSGTLIPGHGGILDRFDAVLFVAPAVYFYAIWVLL